MCIRDSMYRALYRKWRPATFEDVVGQAGITTALKNQILHDKVGPVSYTHLDVYKRQMKVLMTGSLSVRNFWYLGLWISS